MKRKKGIMPATVKARLYWLDWDRTYPDPEERFEKMQAHCIKVFSGSYAANKDTYDAVIRELCGLKVETFEWDY